MIVILGSGAIQPSNSWQNVELPIDASGLIVQFSGPTDWNQVKSRLLVRRVLAYENTKMWDTDFKLYPHQDSPLLTFNLLPPPMYGNVSSSSVEVLKLGYRYPRSYEEPNWKVTLLAII